MTPKEKAEELVNNFTFRCEECDYDWNAKQCALIAVNELIHQCWNYRDVDLELSCNYWKIVKEEINKL